MSDSRNQSFTELFKAPSATEFEAALADRDFYRDAAARYGNHDFLCDARQDSKAVCVCGWSDFKRVHLHGR